MIYPTSHVLIDGPCWQTLGHYEKTTGTRTLNRILQEKDGEHSGAYVKIFRASGNTEGNILYDPKARDEVLVDDVSCKYFDKNKFWFMTTDSKEKNKETLILAKRGVHAHFDLKSSRMFKTLRPSVEMLLNLDIKVGKMNWTRALLAERAYERIRLHRKVNRSPLMLGEVIEHLQAKSDIAYGLIRQAALKSVLDS